jgi:DNA-directed RNA polymerase subunit RPC12/RpoP
MECAQLFRQAEIEPMKGQRFTIWCYDCGMKALVVPTGMMANPEERLPVLEMPPLWTRYARCPHCEGFTDAV